MLNVSDCEPEGAATNVVRLYTPTELCAALGLGKTKVYELLGSGVIASVLIGNRRRVPHAALVRYIGSLNGSDTA